MRKGTPATKGGKGAAAAATPAAQAAVAKAVEAMVASEEPQRVSIGVVSQTPGGRAATTVEGDFTPVSVVEAPEAVAEGAVAEAVGLSDVTVETVEEGKEEEEEEEEDDEEECEKGDGTASTEPALVEELEEKDVERARLVRTS